MTADLLISLPEDVTYKILCFVDQPTNASVHLCKAISVLCTATKSYAESDSLWEIILGGYYLNGQTSTVQAYRSRTQRRSSKRLRRTTAKEDVMHAHYNLRDQTEMALQEVADMAVSRTPCLLSVSKLRRVLHNYGPVLNIDQRSAIGGTLLVDCCRARGVKENTILSCVKELIENFGASPHVSATEGSSFQKKKHNTLPPLVVAAARGMPNVVWYLIQRSGSEALLDIKGTSRFRLYTNPKKSVAGTYTAIDFAMKIKEAETEDGATSKIMKDLNMCIHILRDAQLKNKHNESV